MIVESSLLSEFNRISSKGFGSLTGLSVAWDPDKKRLTLFPKQFGIGAFILMIGSVSMQWSVIRFYLPRGALNDLEEGSPYRMVGFAISCGYMVNYIFGFQVYRKSTEFEEFYNKFAAFDLALKPEIRGQHSNNSALKIMENYANFVRSASFVCRAIYFTTTLPTPMLVAVTSVAVPGFPANIFSYYPGKVVVKTIHLIFSSGNGKCSRFGLGVEKVVTFCFGYYAFSLAVQSWSFLLFHIVIGSTGLASAILGLELKLKSGNENGRKSNQMCGESWILIYRQIQILCKLFNQLSSGILFVLCFVMTTYQVVFGCSLLSSWHELQASVTIFNTVGAVNGMIALFFLFSFCAKVYMTSLGCLKGMKGGEAGELMKGKGKTHRELKQRKKLLRSIPILKVEFGAANYIETLTPVIFQNFAVLRLIDCLLVLNRRH